MDKLKLKSDQDGIERNAGTNTLRKQVKRLKSDQDGIESPYREIANFAAELYVLKSDQDGIESVDFEFLEI